MIQRYELYEERDRGYGSIAVMQESDIGDYVLYDDHVAEIIKRDTYIHQLRGALGYEVPGHIPENPNILNGLSDAKEKQIAEKDARIKELEAESTTWRQVAEINAATIHKEDARIKELEAELAGRCSCKFDDGHQVITEWCAHHWALKENAEAAIAEKDARIKGNDYIYAGRDKILSDRTEMLDDARKQIVEKDARIKELEKEITALKAHIHFLEVRVYAAETGSGGMPPKYFGGGGGGDV